jgi:hypothetical protein
MEAFGTAFIAICIVAVVVAALSYAGSGKLYKGIGKTGALTLDEPELRPSPKPGSAAAQAEAAEEIRQMVEAKSARRVARGQAPLDVDAEIAALTAPVVSNDPELRDEVRQHVIARNERRVRKGQAPLDVEAEVDRHLREYGS